MTLISTLAEREPDTLGSSSQAPPPISASPRGKETCYEKKDTAPSSAGVAVLAEDAAPVVCDVRIAVVGNVDGGKSTTVGVLTQNINDDGRGLARRHVFNFQHELENGRTSSMAQEIMGFNALKEQIMIHHREVVVDERQRKRTTAHARNQTWGKIVREANSIATFLDLCGHERYLKTTIVGLVGTFPDYAMLVTAANTGSIQRMTGEHLKIAVALRLPVFAVVTKVDIAPPDVLKQALLQLQKLLKTIAPRQLLFAVRDVAEAKTAAQGILSGCLCPIFKISNVTGEGLQLLRIFIGHLKSRVSLTTQFRSASEPAEFYIDSVYTVAGVGTVLAGTLKSGTLHINQQLLLGPDKTGEFRPVLVRSIQNKRVFVSSVCAGQAASLSLRALGKKDILKRNAIRKGMVLVDRCLNPKAVYEFEAYVTILHHATTLKEKYQAVIHSGVIRQAAQVVYVSGSLLRTGDSGVIRFRFMYYPEYMTVGTPLLFREGQTKGLGNITSLHCEA